jgi:hypothetical protein
MRNLLILLLLVVSNSCSKKPAKMLVGTWEIVKIEKSENGNAFIEVPLDCQLGEIRTFTKDGNYKIVTNTSCGATTTINGTWSLGADEKTISLTFIGIGGIYYDEIVELTKKNLIILYDSGLSNTTYFKYYFTRQKT